MRSWSILTAAALALSSPVIAQNAPPPRTEKPAADEGFNDALREAFPLSPSQINAVVRRVEETRQAATAQPPVQLRSRVLPGSLAPGAPPIEVILRSGYPTSFSFSDSTGALWPVETVSNGHSEALDVNPANPTTPFFDVAPKSAYVETALNVRLKGAPRPIVIKLREPPRIIEADAAIEIRIRDALGPNASPPIIDRPNLVAGEDPILMSVLQGIAPDGGIIQSASLPDIQAWLVGQQLYVRSPHELLSPAYDARMRAAGGVSAYTMTPRPVLVVSVQGKPMQVSLEARRQGVK